MSNKTSRWLRGCGIGCGLIVLVGLVLWVGGCLFLKQTFRGVEQAIESHEELIDRFGEIDGFVPPADGAMPSDRVERFLAVRETLGEHQATVEAILAEIPGPDVDSEDVAGILMKMFGILGDLIATGGEYVNTRNRALLEQDMGLGEYLYIYSTAYYSWLGYVPEDGPERTVDGRRERLLAGDEDEDQDAICAPQSLRRRWRRSMSAMLDNQLAALPPEGAGDPWHERLTAEIERFDDDPRHVPWHDGLPPAIAASLEPYRDRFEATYNKTCNCFEVPPAEGEMEWNWAD
ncbi:MAG: hypothetical protein GY856_05330 [bacterium]|nr:hypothetical protein [bacterium]